MGAWGEKPWENDTAADMFYQLEKVPITQVVENGLNSENEDEQIAAAWLYSRVGMGFVYPVDLRSTHKKLAVEKLTDILANDDWLDRWKDRSAKEASIKRVLRDIKNLR